MIHNQAEFEDALEEALELFDRPRPADSPEDHRLAALLAEIALYHPPAEPPPPPDLDAERRARLEARADALRRRATGEGYSADLMNAVDTAVERLIHPFGPPR